MSGTFFFKPGDLVRGHFVDHSDHYPGGSPKHKDYVGLVTGVFMETGCAAYRVKVLVQEQEHWAMDYQLKLMESICK